MRIILLFTNLVFISITLFTQTPDAKRDNIWLFGYDSNPTNPLFGGTVLDFNQMPVDIEYEFRNMDFWVTCASICSKEGGLLFYTNGLTISNSQHFQMLNGDGLNPGGWTPAYEDGGYPAEQGALILPQPNNDSIYFLIHGLSDWVEGGPYHIYSKLSYSMININAGNGLGAVIDKNILILEDTLDEGIITSVRHGNGRDWWIFVHEYDSNRYYRLLLDINGIHFLEPQILGDTVLSGLGQAVFSPDGSKYVRYEGTTLGSEYFVNIYDFDRCEGLLSNQIQFSIQDSAYSMGAAISPNSRFLYLPSFVYVYQYDLWASDIEASKDTVAIYDGFRNSLNLSTTFFMAQLAPDDKIYINAPGGLEYLHVIHNPNEKGEACNLEQHGVKLPTYNASTMPNFPNFRLGKWEGSPCDSIISSTQKLTLSEPEIHLYPNPTRNNLYLKFFKTFHKKSELVLFNQVGQKMKQFELDNEEMEFHFSVSDLPSGMYFYRISECGVLRKSGKVIVQK